MASITKFQFGTDFDALAHRSAPEEVDAPPSPPPPRFTEAELAAATAEAFERGRAAGRSDADAATERRTADALAAIRAALDGIAPAHDRAMEGSRTDALRLAAALTRKLIPAMLQQNALAVVESLVNEILPRLVDEPRLVIRVNDTLIASLKGTIDDVAAHAGYRGHVILLGDDRLAEADCRIEWADGGAEHDTDRLMHEIETLVDRFIHGVGEQVPSAPGTAVNDDTEEMPNG